MGNEKVVSRCACAITLLAGLQSGWIGPLLPSIAVQQGFPLEKAGLIISAIWAGALTALAVSRPIIARLADLKTIILASAMTALGFAGLATLGGLWPLAASALCYGLGVGLNGIASHIFIPRYHPDHVAAALSKLNVFFGFGALIGPLVVLAVVKLNAPYHWIFAGASLAGLAVCLFLARAALQPQAGTNTAGGAAPEQKSEGSFASIIFNPLLIAIVFVNFLYVGVETSLGAWLFTFVQRGEGLDAAIGSSASSLLFVGLTLGRIISTRLCLSFNSKYVTIAAMILLTGAVFALAAVHGGEVVTLLVVLAIGMGMGPIFPTLIAQSATRFPQASSAATTLTIAAGNFGAMLIPWLGGYALTGIGPANFMFILAGLSAVLPVLFGLALFSPLRRLGQTA